MVDQIMGVDKTRLKSQRGTLPKTDNAEFSQWSSPKAGRCLNIQELEW
jgi:hypothetical protein